MNLEYRLPNGQKVKFLDDQKTYLGNQLESEFGGERCFGIVANMDFIMICTYEKDGADPKLLLYKKKYNIMPKRHNETYIISIRHNRKTGYIIGA